MPIYEFSCLSCRHTFDVFGRYESREQKQVCPRCEGTNTKALFSTFAMSSSGRAETSESSGGCGGCGGACSCAN